MYSKRYTVGLIAAAALLIVMYTKVAGQSIQSPVNVATYGISPEAAVDDTSYDAQTVLDTDSEQPSNGGANH